MDYGIKIALIFPLTLLGSKARIDRCNSDFNGVGVEKMTALELKDLI